jgi:large subunit ribosomal protein L7/L12
MLTKVTKEEVISALEKMKPAELGALITDLENAWGVKVPTIPIPLVGIFVPGEEKVEQSEFTVQLTSFPGNKKVQVIKLVREITGLGLKEAKELAESVPKVLKEYISKDEVQKIKVAFEETEAVLTVT